MNDHIRKHLPYFLITLCIALILIIMRAQYGLPEGRTSIWIGLFGFVFIILPVFIMSYIQKPQILKMHEHRFIILYGLTIAALLYIIFAHTKFYNSAALYMGIPLAIALSISFFDTGKSIKSVTTKTITIALLLSSLVFQEGYICIIMSAPIFYLIGFLIAYPIDHARQKKTKISRKQAALVATTIALLSLEGATDLTTFNREHSVTVKHIVAASPTQVRAQLAKTPQFDQNKPFFLKIFPYPADISGSGLNVGDTRRAHFVAYKKIWWNKVEGELVFRVTESKKDYIRFDVIKDNSYISHYLTWQPTIIKLKEIAQNKTEVTCTLYYKRLLDPIWYFGPMQYYAVKLTAQELLEHVLTPSTI